MTQDLTAQLALLPVTLSHHLLLSMSALLTGILICIPLAILISRVKALQWPALTFASIVQTIPGLALLALMVPLLGQIGFLPAFIALVLYSMLPILHNTVTGILGVDRSVIEAARGIGMTSFQQLLKVELPLATPIIIAGVRTSAVWVVGTATLATPVGATSLGNYIFSGLQTQNTTAVLVGCIAAAALAISLDQLIRLLERSARQHSRRAGMAAVMGLLLLFSAGFAPLILKRGTTKIGTLAPVVVGAKTFTEQYILAEFLTVALKQAGLPAISKTSLGSIILFEALAAGEVDCYADYSGTIWANVMKRTDIPPRAVLLEQMTRWLDEKYQVRLLGPLGFENTYALAISKESSLKRRISTLEELSAHASALRIGSDYEFFSRPEWFALKKSYGLQFAEQRTFDPSLMYAAIRAGSVDVISAYSTDGRLAAYDLVVLQDPHGALPPYDAVLLLAPAIAHRPDVVAALTPLLGTIADERMREANKMVDLERKSVAEAAAFLWNLKERTGKHVFNTIPP